MRIKEHKHCKSSTPFLFRILVEDVGILEGVGDRLFLNSEPIEIDEECFEITRLSEGGETDFLCINDRYLRVKTDEDIRLWVNICQYTHFDGRMEITRLEVITILDNGYVWRQAVIGTKRDSFHIFNTEPSQEKWRSVGKIAEIPDFTSMYLCDFETGELIFDRLVFFGGSVCSLYMDREGIFEKPESYGFYPEKNLMYFGR